MKKNIALICSILSPGPCKVIRNLREVVKKSIDVQWIPLEHIVAPPVLFKSKKMNYRYLRLHEHIKFFDIKKLLKYGEQIFFVGWGAANEALLKTLNKKGIRPSLIMCSTVGQSDFNDFERNSIVTIIDNVKSGNIRLFLLNKRIYDSLGKILPNSIFFPHTIDMRQYEGINPAKLSGINADIFCAIRSGKNVMNQILAFKLSGISGNLHVNFKNRQISRFIQTVGVNTKEHTWLKQSDYYALISGMTLSLQATFTESFSYAVAERMCLGIPVITSYDIYLTAEDAFLSKYLCIKTLDTPFEIGRRIRIIAENTKLRKELADRCRTRIKRIAAENNRTALECLRDILE